MQASDGRTGADAMDTVTVTVTVDNEDEDGTVTLTTLQPVDGKEITATLSDPDGTPTGTPEWQWANSDSADGPFTNIEEDAEDATYIPVPDDKTKLPARDGDLHRPAGRRQDRSGGIGQCGAGGAERQHCPCVRG